MTPPQGAITKPSLKLRAATLALGVVSAAFMLSGCAELEDQQDAAPCVQLEDAWDTFVAERSPDATTGLAGAFDAFNYSSSTETAADAAALGKQNFYAVLNGDRSKNQYFWNSLDLIKD